MMMPSTSTRLAMNDVELVAESNPKRRTAISSIEPTTHPMMTIDTSVAPTTSANLGPSPSGSVSVLLQDPSHPGTLKTAQSYAGFGQPLCVAVADLNADGRPDIAVADGDTATVMLQTTTPGVFASGTQL